MRLHAFSVSSISRVHSALKSSELFRRTSKCMSLVPSPCWGLWLGTDITLHWGHRFGTAIGDTCMATPGSTREMMTTKYLRSDPGRRTAVEKRGVSVGHVP
ncbi:hypothetical protein EYF80_046576 [Liparis tanakae]|uniref:Uncharacterized protein n=1 Tax=Liparis tanakae TaxID=230148 RepID=A0A4Z2FQW0_9TELE|nr:hypothetical protein EYF80_046576 [Liparis tanakae]